MNKSVKKMCLWSPTVFKYIYFMLTPSLLYICFCSVCVCVSTQLSSVNCQTSSVETNLVKCRAAAVEVIELQLSTWSGSTIYFLTTLRLSSSAMLCCSADFSSFHWGTPLCMTHQSLFCCCSQRGVLHSKWKRLKRNWENSLWISPGADWPQHKGAQEEEIIWCHV